MQSPIAGKILETLSDRGWHRLEDVAQILKASVEDVTNEVGMLAEAGVLVYDEKTKKAKLSQWLLEIEEKAEAGKRSAVGSIILPPEGQVSIQNIVISNFLDKPVELGIRADAKLREISISRVE